ncbi:hypothetical protein SmB9_18850 [Sphingosinicella microcystinivorans]|uniref:Uncharacterized protein n=1 Tax=Sphingosinicella microcystinivorans TaxID=335406 RepID=A0AAD1G0U2_SPHMI|nr:hypothetical protein SmB9_18850 [Sphingosinicella microcystinivorans]
MPKVERREQQQQPAEHRPYEIGRHPRQQHGEKPDKPREQFHDPRERRDRRAAAPTATAQREGGKQRHKLERAERPPARIARGTPAHDRASLRQARRDKRKEAADDGTGKKPAGQKQSGVSDNRQDRASLYCRKSVMHPA